MMWIVAYRGQITTAKAFIKRLQKRREITTQDILSNASVACFKAKRMYYSDADNQAGISGIGAGQITFVKKKALEKLGAEIDLDVQADFPNHALMSKISAQDAFNCLRSSGVHFANPLPDVDT